MAEREQIEKIINGFDIPEQNYSKLPHQFIDKLYLINSLAELKCVLYLLRHTWGYSEFGLLKKITTDEFMNGRKLKDRTRIDKGTGLSNKSVIAGLELAELHGFIVSEIDQTDKARIKKYYSLNIIPSDADDQSGVKKVHSWVKKVHTDYEDNTHRSEKETSTKKLKRNNNKLRLSKAAKPKSTALKASDFKELELYKSVTKRYPAKATWETVIQAIRDIQLRIKRPATVEDLKPFYVAWCSRGWNEYAITWLTSYAVENRMPITGNDKQTKGAINDQDNSSTTSQQDQEASRAAALLALQHRQASNAQRSNNHNN